jgi:uncharacterized membrane-anchored protein
MDRSQQQCAPIYFHHRTKKLIQWIPESVYALLEHQDIDETAAWGLIEKKVKAVLNYKPSMTGEYASMGTLRLVEHGIPVYDIDHPQFVKGRLRQGQTVRLAHGRLWGIEANGAVFMSSVTEYTLDDIMFKLRLASLNFNQRFQLFVQNTVDYLHKELPEILKPLQLPQLKTDLENKSVVIVTRGSGYRDDLQVLTPYIHQINPVLIGVDGGADAILSSGFTPHLILGDMDSVSLTTLHCGAELIVHAYRDGRAPGLEVVKRQGLNASILRCLGTSEDAAHLLAYHAGASLIISVGSHSHMLDFLEKGRNGMASTLLVRLLMGNKLIDAKGIHHLFPAGKDWEQYARRERHHTRL